MSVPSPKEPRASIASAPAADTFLETLRKSTELAQELLSSNREMSIRLTSLEGELESVRTRNNFLEAEIGRLRDSLSRDVRDQMQIQLSHLAEEQNCLAHMFVASDRLWGVHSADDAFIAAEELLHNLVGALHYGIFVERADGPPLLVAPSSQRYRRGVEDHQDLVVACIASGTSLRPHGVGEDQVPLCVPLHLRSRVVGAMLIVSLVPQLSRVDRLQRDLVSLLSERLATSVCVGAACRSSEDNEATWADLRSSLCGVDGR